LAYSSTEKVTLAGCNFKWAGISNKFKLSHTMFDYSSNTWTCKTSVEALTSVKFSNSKNYNLPGPFSTSIDKTLRTLWAAVCKFIDITRTSPLNGKIESDLK